MLDWEGHLTATVFVSGCNLRCPYCHNPDLLVSTGDADTAPLMEHLSDKRDWLDGVVVTGGEPTLDPHMFELLDDIATLCLPVKLDTNGTQPTALRELIESRLLAAVSLDIKTSPDRYGELGSGDIWPVVSDSIHTILGAGVPHEFRTTAYPELVGAEDCELIAREIDGGDRYTIQQFRPDRTYERAAGSVRPHAAEYLADAAAHCRQYLPTTVRGA
jgi:pyruvate formate lyase activating enzyme